LTTSEVDAATTNPYPHELWAVIPAAGFGTRMQGDIPKQYLFLDSVTIMEHVINRLLAIPGLVGCVIALAPDDKRFGELSVAEDPRVHTVVGGETRADSVNSAIDAVRVQAADDAWVLVHDAARPLVALTDIKRLTDAVFNSGSDGGILAIPVSDTLKYALNSAMATTDIDVTDEASAMEYAGHDPLLVEALEPNPKVTRYSDLVVANALSATYKHGPGA